LIVDTSALCAILFAELEAQSFADLLRSPDRKLMSAMNAFEAGMVIESRMGTEGANVLWDIMQSTDIDIVAFDATLAEVALDAWRQFGKGHHPAGLNFADCAAYALARVTNQPLLYKGEDFSLTDIVRAR